MSKVVMFKSLYVTKHLYIVTFCIYNSAYREIKDKSFKKILNKYGL